MTSIQRVALVTGGSRGIGRAICVRLARMGMKVGINYVSNPTAAEETLRLIEEAGGGQGFLAPFNVADASAVQEHIKTILDVHGRIDILVNNAGITRDGLVARMKEDDWDSVLDTNLKGAFLCSKVVMRAMMKQKWGRIINIASVVGCTGNSGQVNYSAAKAGLIGINISRSGEVVPGDIITAIDGKSVDSVGKLLSHLDDYRVGDTVRVTVLRKGKSTELKVTLQPGT